MQLQIENTSICNAACVFCPYPTMKREHGTMGMGLFHKIIDEAVTIPAIDLYTLTGLGEPMLDPHLYERIEYIRSKLQSVPISMFTNGSRLTPDHIDKLSKSGITTVYVSLNAVNPKQREETMRLKDYDRVVAGIKHAIKHGDFETVVKGIVSKDLMEVGDSETFMETWGGPTSEGGRAFLHLEGNWAGATWPVRVLPQNACGRALSQIMVLQDGRVSLCCFDGEGEVVFGDLNDQTIRDIYASQPYLDYRVAHVEGRRGELKLCATCTAI